MTNDYTKGAKYRAKTDANFRRRRKYAAEIKAARARLVKPGKACASRAASACAGPLELHHVNGDLSGRSGYRVMCRKHNRAADGQRPGRMTKPHARKKGGAKKGRRGRR